VKAALQHRYGPPDVVEVAEVDRPEATEDRVLVRVRAASVNRADLDGMRPRWQFIRLFNGFRRPKSPRIGIDVAGVVESVGPDVTRFKPGDRVFGDLFSFGAGAFAEYVCARERAFAAIPERMSFDDAATLPHSAVLALQGLRLRKGRSVGPGDRLLIVGASGNVGPFAVQIAKSRGAHVTGMCRTEKVEFVRSLGADEVLDYTAVDWTRGDVTYDWILDVDAHQSIVRSRRALRPGGVYVAQGGSALWLLQALFIAPFLSRFTDRWSGLLLWWRPFQAAQDDVATLLALIAAGKLRPVIDRRYSLDQIVDALRWVEDGRAKGKVVILPVDGDRPAASGTLPA